MFYLRIASASAATFMTSLPACAADYPQSRMIYGSAYLRLAFDDPGPKLSSDVAQRYVNENYPDLKGRVCSAVFADLGQKQERTLLITIDFGRDLCNSLLVVRRTGSHYTETDLQVEQINDVESLVSKAAAVDHNALIIDEIIGFPEMTRCMAMVPFIYDIQLGQLRDVSTQYPAFYRNRIKTWRRDMSPMAEDDPSETRNCEDCYTMEIDKMKRLGGIDPRAGYATAVAWMTSPDADRRARAALVFADIADKDSLSKLAALAASAAGLASRVAHDALYRLNAHVPHGSTP